jgi:type IX secretion system PorP/SprF family membrane protein
MKKSITAVISILFHGVTIAQQMPVSENYFMDKYSLSSSYAGHFNPGSLFTSFRTDWTGIVGGPKTLRLSYSDMLMTNAGLGGKIIYDKAGIFEQLYVMGTYSYSLTIVDEHKVLLALSAGIYHNKINFTDYYNNPNYNIDPVMIQQDVSSKVKFMSDFSALYLFKGIEAGVMFANINFGDAKYDEVDVTYKPFANYQLHAAYSYTVNDRWDINPLIYLRGGKFITGQVGIASMVKYQNNIWGSLSFRDPGIWGFGFGANIAKGIRFSYNFNFASSVALNIYNNHEISIGVNINDLFKKTEKSELADPI